MNPRDEVHEFRTSVDRQINSTLAVGTASAGQNLQFGSGGFSWVTPSSVSFDDLAPSGGGSPGMLTTDGATWSYVSYATARSSLGGGTPTGTGVLVLQDEPALSKPDLGVPAAGTLSNCTGLPTAGLVSNAVTNAKLAQMATSTFKGRNTAGTGDPEDMTVAQVLAKLLCPYVVASEAGNPVRTIGVSSTAEATFCTLTVPAGTLGTAGKCLLELVGDITNNSGGANSYRLKVKFGATTVYDKTSSFSTGTQPRPLVIRVHLCALGATNAQRVTTELYHGYLFTATVGNGDWGDFNGRAFTMQGSAAEDSTAAKSLAVTVQNSVSNANINWRLYSAKLVCTP